MISYFAFVKPVNMSIMTAELIFDAKAKLGEGALWDDASGKLYWVDIEGGSFNIFNPVTSRNVAFSIGKRVGTVVPADSSHVLLAVEDGMAILNIETGDLSYRLRTGIHHEGKRFNDGKCDPQGRFWVGSMSLNDIPAAGSLYCITEDFVLIEKVQGVSISNGIVWGVSGDVMYYIDTPTRQVVRYSFDPSNGEISEKTIVVHVPDGMGYPDGMAIDNEGMLWVALWGGFGVARFDPVTGKLLQKIYVPAPNVTSCAFGGKDLSTLYITTARVDVAEDELKKYPLSGGIFSVDMPVKGLPAVQFKGNL